MRNSVFLMLSLLAIFTVSSFSTVDPINSIEFYGPSQEKSLDELISESYQNSKVPILYFYADWCPPCLEFKKSLKHKDVQKALSNATLIKINVDNDSELFAGDYGVREIPTFIKVDASGQALAKINNTKWGKGKPKFIAPAIRDFVNK